MGNINIDVGAIVTSISLVIASIAAFIVALKDKKNTAGEEKAISVTKINETDKKVEILIDQVDFLFDEISRLRSEKINLEKIVAKLQEDLQVESSDHTVTKQKLAQALEELENKNKRLKDLEGIVGIKDVI